jgi:hypothetical protein
MSVPNIKVWAVHNSNGKLQIKTTCSRVYRELMEGKTPSTKRHDEDWWRGFTVQEGELSWKAQRAIARAYRDAGGKL